MTCHEDKVTSDHTQQIRPPGALAEPVFRETCVQCHDCRAVCPLAAITRDDEGYPRLQDPRGCGHCGLCADVCSRQAIRFTQRTRLGFALVQAVERACLTG